ncbi:MAG: DNA repair protein RecO [Chloroflexi bacterium]|nr:DNA repair protein RecO [Chloroflexota bacterium]
MSRLYKTQGVILSHSYVGEADALLSIYTPFLGKLRAVARGVKRSKSRMAGHLEPLTHCSLMLARGRNLDIISGCDTIEAFAPLKASLWLTSCGLYAAELTDRMGVEGTENRRLFQLLLGTLQSLSSGVEPSTVLRYFEFRSMACSGYLPEIWRCVACGHSLEMAAHSFSPTAGGLLCPQCRPANGSARTVSVRAIKVLRFFSRQGLAAVARLRLKPEVLREIEGLMQLYVTYVLDQEVNSARWLRALQAGGEDRTEQHV